MVYRWLWNAQDAADVVQDTFVRLWRMRARVRVETVEPLVYTIALNLARKRRRWQRLRRFVGLSDQTDPTPEPGVLLDRHLRQQRLREAIEDLPEDLREVVTLCALSGLTYPQVAETLNIPVGTVGSRRNRAIDLLRTALDEDTHA